MNVVDSLRIASSSTAAAPANRLGQAEFLQLLTTQLQNQDPFKPMENGEFLGQMAQFSTASGINDLQAGFSQLAGALTQQQTLQAAALVGREVLVPGDQAALASGGRLDGVVDVPASGSVRVTVYDGAGRRVRELPLGIQSTGPAAFSWDGRDAAGREMPVGSYRITAAVSQGSAEVAADTALRSRIESVSLADGAVRLQLAGRSPVTLDQIRQVF
jgi:flagellar basal-body rod modification protein FlgD